MSRIPTDELRVILSASQAAAVFGVHASTWFRWVERGTGPLPEYSAHGGGHFWDQGTVEFFGNGLRTLNVFEDLGVEPPAEEAA